MLNSFVLWAYVFSIIGVYGIVSSGNREFDIYDLISIFTPFVNSIILTCVLCLRASSELVKIKVKRKD